MANGNLFETEIFYSVAKAKQAEYNAEFEPDLHGPRFS
jgi:hypothetical protein